MPCGAKEFMRPGARSGQPRYQGLVNSSSRTARTFGVRAGADAVWCRVRGEKMASQTRCASKLKIASGDLSCYIELRSSTRARMRGDSWKRSLATLRPSGSFKARRTANALKS